MKSRCQFLKLRCTAWGILKKVVRLISNDSENNSKHAFCLMELYGLKEKHWFNEITLKTPKCAMKSCFEAMKVLFIVGLCFLDFENETLGQHHLHKLFGTIFDLKHFFEKLKRKASR